MGGYGAFMDVNRTRCDGQIFTATYHLVKWETSVYLKLERFDAKEQIQLQYRPFTKLFRSKETRTSLVVMSCGQLVTETWIISTRF